LQNEPKSNYGNVATVKV